MGTCFLLTSSLSEAEPDTKTWGPNGLVSSSSLRALRMRSHWVVCVCEKLHLAEVVVFPLRAMQKKEIVLEQVFRGAAGGGRWLLIVCVGWITRM